MSTDITEHKTGEPWSSDKIRECARVFTTTGNYTKTAELTGVSRNTIAAWEHRGNTIWVDSCTFLQHEKNREMRNKYVLAAEKALDHTISTLEQATPAQSAVISGVFLDKSRLIDNQPTSIKAGNSDAAINALAKQFKSLAATYKARNRGVIAVQDEESDD